MTVGEQYRDLRNRLFLFRDRKKVRVNGQVLPILVQFVLSVTEDAFFRLSAEEQAKARHYLRHVNSRAIRLYARDPLLGDLTLTDEHDLEVLDNGGWKRIYLAELYMMAMGFLDSANFTL